jgi:hypothetical protein
MLGSKPIRPSCLEKQMPEAPTIPIRKWTRDELTAYEANLLLTGKDPYDVRLRDHFQRQWNDDFKHLFDFYKTGDMIHIEKRYEIVAEIKKRFGEQLNGQKDLGFLEYCSIKGELHLATEKRPSNIERLTVTFKTIYEEAPTVINFDIETLVGY